MEIRLFEKNDLLKCTRLFIDVFNQEPWNDKWTEERARQYLLDYTNTPGFMGIIAVKGEEIIGFIFGASKVWWNGNEFFINEMCVTIEKQKNGIGSMLLTYLLKELRSKNISNLSLLTNRGIPAEAFYKKNEFTEMERLIFLNRDV